MHKYLFIAANGSTPWGGSELLWSQAAEKLARRGMKVRVSVPDFGRPITETAHLRSAGCQIVYRKAPSILYRLGRKVLPLREHMHMHVKSAGKGVDLVVVSQGSNFDGLGWMEAAREVGLKYAVIAHSAPVYGWPDDDIAERLADGYENAAAAYFVSQAILELSRRQFANPLLKGKVVRNPFNVRYDACAPFPVEPSEEFALACVGRLEVSSKGHDLLLGTLSLPHWRERNARVSIVGKGPNERVLRRLVQQLSLTNVEFAGHLNSIEEIWRNHHALVLPSRVEGMPLAVVEAMLCGRPCIVTDVGGNRELVRDGVNGFLAKAPTVQLLDEAMNRAWEARHRLKEMGEAAAADVRRWVSRDPAEDFVRELETLVEEEAP